MLGQLDRIPGVGPGLDFRARFGDRRFAFLPPRNFLWNRQPVLQRRRVGLLGLGQELVNLQFQLQDLDETLFHQRLVLRPESAERIVVRVGVAGDEPHGCIVVGGLLDPAGTEGAARVAAPASSTTSSANTGRRRCREG